MYTKCTHACLIVHVLSIHMSDTNTTCHTCMHTSTHNTDIAKTVTPLNHHHSTIAFVNDRHTQKEQIVYFTTCDMT